MTLDQLLELDSTALAGLTDEQLLAYLAPCLKDCPPIELKVIQDKEQKVLDIKNAKKLVLKTEKQLERQAKKDPLNMLKQLDDLLKLHST